MTGIPNPRAANALAVTVGCTTVGYVVKSDGAFFSFDVDEFLLGEFETQRQAIRAIPARAGVAGGSAVKQTQQ
jgi:hypothetical protein